MSIQNKASVLVEHDIIHIRGTIDGKRYQRSTGKKNTPRNLTWATKHAYDVLLQKIVESQKVQYEYGEDETPTLKQFGFMTLNLETSDRCENTRDEYLADFKSHILPYFGDSKLDEIRPKDLRLWQANLLHTRSGVRVINIRNVFNNIMKDAFIDEIILDNPFNKVKRPKKKKSKIFSFKLEEVKKLIDKAEGWFQNYLIISFFTGIRPGELIALEWENIDFENHKIHIRKSMRKGKLTDTKTYASLRDVDILPIVEKALKSQQKITSDKKNLFVTQYGKGYKRSEKISSKWKPLLEKCDIEYRILYKTRHTFASVMIQQGEEIAWVSKMLGHADISVTLTKYTDYLPREDIERASFLSNFKV